MGVDEDATATAVQLPGPTRQFSAAILEEVVNPPKDTSLDAGAIQPGVKFFNMLLLLAKPAKSFSGRKPPAVKPSGSPEKRRRAKGALAKPGAVRSTSSQSFSLKPLGGTTVAKERKSKNAFLLCVPDTIVSSGQGRSLLFTDPATGELLKKTITEENGIDVVNKWVDSLAGAPGPDNTLSEPVVAVHKVPDWKGLYSRTTVVLARDLFQKLSEAGMNDGFKSQLQMFVRCKGVKASVYRIRWSRNLPAAGWNISNEHSLFSTYDDGGYQAPSPEKVMKKIEGRRVSFVGNGTVDLRAPVRNTTARIEQRGEGGEGGPSPLLKSQNTHTHIHKCINVCGIYL
jgi:hypothetical protein